MAQAKGASAPTNDAKVSPENETDDDGAKPPRAPRVLTAPGVIDTVEYKPKDGVPLYDAGSVARENFSAVIGNKRVHVYRGAPADILPKEVIKAMSDYGCTIGTISREEFGLKPVVPTGGRRRSHSSNERLPQMPSMPDGGERRDPGGY